MAKVESAVLGTQITALDLSAVERASITNDILRRALERVKSDAQTELSAYSAHHTHHCSHSVHSNGW